MGNLQNIKFCNGKVKKLMNRLNYASRQKDETYRRTSDSANVPIKCSGIGKFVVVGK